MKPYSKLHILPGLAFLLISFAGTAQKGSSLPISTGTLLESALYTHSKK